MESVFTYTDNPFCAFVCLIVIVSWQVWRIFRQPVQKETQPYSGPQICEECEVTHPYSDHVEELERINRMRFGEAGDF